MPVAPWKPLPDEALQRRLLQESNDRGAIEIYHPAPNVYVTRTSGFCSEEFARA